MAMVVNWKSPKGTNTAKEVEAYLEEQGIKVRVSQTHRVPSGKLNTTFDGDPIQLQNLWTFLKNLEKQEILARYKKKKESLGM